MKNNFPSCIRILSFVFVMISGTETRLTAQKKIDVYLLAGQSNATGQGYIKNLPVDFMIDTTVLLFHSGMPHLNSGRDPFTWIPLRPASESTDRFGPELGFGNRIHQLYRKHRIAIIKHAHSGTNLYQQWWPGQNANDTTDWGPQYKIFVQTVQLGLAELQRNGYDATIKAMLWQQGEADADKGGDTAIAYGKNLVHFITRVRQQFQVPHMLFIYGYVYPPPNAGEGISAVRKAQQSIDQNAGSSLSVPGALIIQTNDLDHRADDPGTPYPKDHIHFGSKGILELGKRMADAVRKTGKLR